MPPWNSAKAKVQLRLSVQRIRTLQEKKEAQAKSARRDIATLIERGKVETAKLRVEGIINEDLHTELLELLELHAEQLLARFGVLDQNTREPDPGVKEAVCSIIYAAPRTEVKELHVLRDILMHKYGRDFSAAVMENQDGSVSERVLKKLVVFIPSPALVNAYIAEIAKGYGLNWSPPGAEPSDSSDVPEGGAKESITEGTEADGVAHVDDSAVQVAAIPPASKNKGIGDTDESKTSKPATPAPLDDFDALQQRFAALKKR